MDPWDDPLCARALLHLCLCESFELYGMPLRLARNFEVEYNCFHRGKHEGCTNERCAKKRLLGDTPCRTLATWLPKDRVGITLYVDSGLRTFVGIRGRVMLATEQVMQGNVLPAETLVLAHFVLDRAEGGRLEPRVLVFDVSLLGGRDMEGLPPSERYSSLLGLFRNRGGMTTLQWVGEEASAVAQLDGLRKKLPHDIECIVSVGCDPWLLSRVMRVDVGKGSLR